MQTSCRTTSILASAQSSNSSTMQMPKWDVSHIILLSPCAYPHYHFFPQIGTKTQRSGFASHESKEFDGVGAMHQLASASLAALFSVALFVTAHFFIDYRSARSPAFTFVERTFVPL